MRDKLISMSINPLGVSGRPEDQNNNSEANPLSTHLETHQETFPSPIEEVPVNNSSMNQSQPLVNNNSRGHPNRINVPNTMSMDTYSKNYEKGGQKEDENKAKSHSSRQNNAVHSSNPLLQPSASQKSHSNKENSGVVLKDSYIPDCNDTSETEHSVDSIEECPKSTINPTSKHPKNPHKSPDFSNKLSIHEQKQANNPSSNQTQAQPDLDPKNALPKSPTLTTNPIASKSKINSTSSGAGRVRLISDKKADPSSFDSFTDRLVQRHIPGILLAPETFCNKLVLFYHANAEDIGQSVQFCKEINSKFEVGFC